MSLLKEYDPRARAHSCLSVFHTICDDFNEKRLETFPKHYLRPLQTMTIEAFDLFKHLHSCEPGETTEHYLIAAGKILLRLSHLIHNDRIETHDELVAYFRDFKALHGVSHE